MGIRGGGRVGEGPQGDGEGRVGQPLSALEANPGPSGPSPDQGAAGWPQHVLGSQWSPLPWGSDSPLPAPTPSCSHQSSEANFAGAATREARKARNGSQGAGGAAAAFTPPGSPPDPSRQENVLETLRHLPRKTGND